MVGVRAALLVAAGAVLAEGIRYLARRVRAARVSARAAAAAAERSQDVSLRLRCLPPSTLYAGKHALAPLMKREGMAVLSGGVPPASTFPLRGITVTASRPAAQGADESSGPAGPLPIDVHLTAAEVALSQRYAPFAWDALREWLDAHVRSLHSPPAGAGHRTCITAGSMSGVEMLASILVDRGDVVLIEERSFMAAIDVFRSVGAVLIPIPVDSAGLVPEALEFACASLRAAGRPPNLLYTVPVGQNPTGTRLAPDRYQAIYATAVAHGLLIVEDDAYFYLQHRADAPQQPVPVLHGLGPSFLSIDTRGIVLRLDTFSKLLAPGFRIGWLTAPRRYADAYDGLAYVSSQWGCSLSIAVLSSLLGSPGWLEAHVAALQRTMRSRCLALLCALDKHMRGLARWSPPAAGMFLWLRLVVPAPSRETLVEAMDAHGVVAVPGADCSVAGLTQHDPALFHPSGDGAPNPQPGGAAGHGCPQPCAYLRLSYVIDEAEYDGAARRLRALALSLRGGEHSTDSNSRTDLTADDAGTSNVCG